MRRSQGDMGSNGGGSGMEAEQLAAQGSAGSLTHRGYHVSVGMSKVEWSSCSIRLRLVICELRVIAMNISCLIVVRPNVIGVVEAARFTYFRITLDKNK